MIPANKNSGFTVLELLVVIAILGVLSSIVLVSVNKAREKAMIAKAKLEIKSIETAMQGLAFETGYWPGREAAKGSTSPQPADTVACGGNNNEVEDLGDSQAGLTVQNSSYGTSWKGPYMQSVPLDPWGNKYFFDTDYDLAGGITAVVVGSYGPNGVGNNTYDSDNIIDILKQEVCS